MAILLRRVHAGGLKAGDGSPVEFSPVTVITGANAAGKTRVIDAALLAALGYHPDWPRTSDGVLAAASGDRVDVLAAFERQGPDGADTVSIRRTWERSEVKSGKNAGTVRVTTDVECSTYAGRDKAGRERVIQDLLGLPAGKDSREDAETALDVRRFLCLSDDRRRGLILRLSADRVAAEWTAARIRQALPADYHEILDGWAKGEDAAAFLSRIAACAREEVLRLAGELRDARAAAEELEEVEAIEPAYVGGLRAAETAAHVAVSKAAEDSRARVEAARTRVEEAEAANRRAARIHGEIETATQELARLRSAAGPDAGEVGRLRAALIEIDDEFVGLPALTDDARQARAGADRMASEDDTAAFNRATIEAEATSREPDDLARLQVDEGVASARLDEARTALRAADERHAATGAAIAAASLQAMDLAAVVAQFETPDADCLGDPLCPTCGQEVGARVLARLHEALDRTRRSERDAETAVVAAQQARQLALAAVERATDALAAATRQERDARDRSVRAWQARVDEARRLRDDARARAQVARASIAERARAAEDALRATERRRDDVLRALRAAEAAGPDAGRIGELEGRTEVLRSSLQATADVADVRAGLAETERLAVEERDRARRAVDAATTARQEAEERLHRRQHYLDVRAKAAALDEQLAVAKATALALGPRGLLGEVLRSVLDPFMAAVRAVMDGLDLGEFTVRLVDERDAEVFRPGLERGAAFSPLETLSQSERTVVCAGLSVALARLAGLAWRPVLVDEIQSLDGPRWGDRRRKFLRRLARLVADGEIDQVIAVGCPDALDLDESDTIRVIELPASSATLHAEAA